MNSVRLYILFTSLLLVFGLITASCGNTSKYSEGIEGKIIYDLSYPYEESSVMMDLYPTEMIFHFKGAKMHTEIRSSYDILTTDFIIDYEDRTFTQLLKNMSQRYAMKLSESETEDWNNQYPEYVFEPTNETLLIAGYMCNKTIARAPDATKPVIEIYHTKGIGLDNCNWWNPFSQIDGFLMGYDVEQYGMCMRLRAREVKFEHVEPEKFLVPSNYKTVAADEMNKELASVIEEYIQ